MNIFFWRYVFFTMQIIEFVNATVEKMGAIESIDLTTITAIVAIVISSLTLVFAHLRGMSISSFCEYELKN